MHEGDKLLKDIEDFYKKTKLDKVIKLTNNNAPIEYVHIFHKAYPRFKTVRLPKQDFSGEYETLLKKRGSERNFSSKPVTLLKVSQIMKAVAITNKVNEKRSYPSAGARYPIELYIIAFNIKGLKKGVYHFNSMDFVLECLWDTDLSKRVKDSCVFRLLYL